MKKFLIMIILITLISISVLCLQGFANTVTITYLTPETDPTTVAIDNNIIKRFEETHPDVKVNIQHANLEDVLPKLAAQLRAGTAPDIAFFSPRMVPGLVEQGFLLPLEDVFEDIGDIPRKFVTPNLDHKIYDIPIHMESQVLYYRKDLFEKAGIKPPTTFNEWLKAAEALTVDTDGDGKIDQYGIAVLGGMPSNYFYFSAVLWANGADYFDENNNVVIDSPEAIEALEFWGKLAKFAPPGVVNTGNVEVAVQFSEGLASMARFPGRLLTSIDRYNPGLASEIGIVPIPFGPSGNAPLVHAVMNSFIVFSGTKYPEIAKEFVKFYMSGEQYLEYLTASVPGHALPVRSSWLDNPEYFEYPSIKKYKDVIKESIELAYKYGTDFQFRHDTVNPHLGEALSMPTLSTELNKFLAGDVTAEQALKNVANTWRKRFGIK
jgi:ABC-type glycerol-3-phosphate transport system substrate-binding protein